MGEKIFLVVAFGGWMLISLFGALMYVSKESVEEIEAEKVRAEIPVIEIETIERTAPTNLHIDIPLDTEIQDVIYEEAEKNGIDAWLVFALIEQESQFDSSVVSRTGDYGLMQINKINHKWLKEAVGYDDIMDAKDNIRCGCYILGTLAEKYDSESDILMAYNMGEGGAKKLWKKGIHESNYSKSVLEKKEALMLQNLD